MDRDTQYTSMPSSVARGGKPVEFKAPPKTGQQAESGANPLLWALVAISLLLSIVSLYLASAPRGFSADDRLRLLSIADDLRSIQGREIVMTSPLKTTAYIEETFPVSDIFPDNFALQVNGSIPLNQQIAAQSNTGQVVVLNVAGNIPVNASLPVDTAGSKAKITIKKEIPIDTKFYATLKVETVYGKEFNDMIDKLEAIGNRK